MEVSPGEYHRRGAVFTMNDLIKLCLLPFQNNEMFAFLFTLFMIMGIFGFIHKILE